MSAITAGILTIGDELTSGDRVDTNSTWLSEQLLGLGIETAFHLALPDDRRSIADSIAESGRRVGVLLITGGLGPTEDDLTRQALADAMGESLETDERALTLLKVRFEKRGMDMPRRNLQQVQRPTSAALIPNALGTAPGLRAQIGEARVFVMPGVPGEMKHMWAEHVEPALRQLTNGAQRCLTTWIHSVSLAESKVGEMIEDLMQRDAQPVVGTLVRDFVVSVRIRADGSGPDVEDLVVTAARTVRDRLGVYAFGKDDDTLAGVVVRQLAARSASLATAESCTGGLLGSMVTEVSGASAVYRGGWVTYSNEFKIDLLDVAPETIEQHGAVSGLTADQLAIGALAQSGSSFALAITGIAGPDGGSSAKPVGTVFVALAFIDEDGEPSSHVRRFVFPGNREMIRQRAAITALAMLHFHLANDGLLPEMLGEYRPRVEV
ncbi:MAG: CinA family nicotinamide mononucleotide deamidase-related protein [Phycisphaerales bacterium]|nr:CinA family nicotinamide mononucleotide deamidase-related protein [Phycisphaerales bacterium]